MVINIFLTNEEIAILNYIVKDLKKSIPGIISKILINPKFAIKSNLGKNKILINIYDKDFQKLQYYSKKIGKNSEIVLSYLIINYFKKNFQIKFIDL